MKTVKMLVAVLRMIITSLNPYRILLKPAVEINKFLVLKTLSSDTVKPFDLGDHP
jgi:hypothetical protein